MFHLLLPLVIAHATCLTQAGYVREDAEIIFFNCIYNLEKILNVHNVV